MDREDRKKNRAINRKDLTPTPIHSPPPHTYPPGDPHLPARLYLGSTIFLNSATDWGLRVQTRAVTCTQTLMPTGLLVKCKEVEKRRGTVPGPRALSWTYIPLTSEAFPSLQSQRLGCRVPSHTPAFRMENLSVPHRGHRGGGNRGK